LYKLPAFARGSSGVVARKLSAYHGSSSLSVATSAPSISPASSRWISTDVTTPPS
jgi:hypothetical protein